MARSMAATIEAANAALLAERNKDAVGDYFTEDYVAHVTDKDMKGGHAFVRTFLGMIERGFPDLQVEVEILVEGEDRIAWQRTLRATHEGDYGGSPATGRKIVWRDMVTSRFEGGLIAEEWVLSDLAERLLLARKR